MIANLGQIMMRLLMTLLNHLLLLMIRADITVSPDQRFCQNFGHSGAGSVQVVVALQQVAEYCTVNIDNIC